MDGMRAHGVHGKRGVAQNNCISVRRVLLYLTLTICCGLLLWTVFRTDASLVNGLVMGKVCWFHGAMGVMSMGVLISVLLQKGKNVHWNVADGLVLGMAVWVLLSYDWALDPEPEKLLFGGQLVVLWFLLRFAFSGYPALCKIVVRLWMIVGLAEASWGLLQLYGYKASAHYLFRLTGSFYNPGPYSGFLACILPLCVGIITNTVVRRRVSVFDIIYYFAWVCGVAIVIVLPAGMSRSAWLAALAGCIWVYGWQRITKGKINAIWRQYKKWLMAGSLVGALLIFAAFIGVYGLKKESADGRLLMWKVTARAVAGHPLTGVGLGGFPAAYAEAQADYFASGKATGTEKMVAGCPEYAFNEYLQIALEEGIIGLLLFLGWLGFALYRGIKGKQYGATGGMIALMVFAFSSYPLQLPSFWILLIFLTAICFGHTDDTDETDRRRFFVYKSIIIGHFFNRCFLCALLVLLSFGLYWQQRGMREVYRHWSKAKLLYQAKAYEAAYPVYDELYPQLKHKPDFLFEGGQCLSKMERYADANEWLLRATLLSSDPMIHYIISKNDQMQGHCAKAEGRLLHAIDMLPERIYPYYLLTKLYADSICFQPEKMWQAADSVLYKEPKVMTTAIREMREEIEKMRDEW